MGGSHWPVTRRTVLKRVGGASVVGATGLSTLSGGVAARRCSITVPDDHATIQAAVDAADPGATVCVDGGTYREQVIINKDLTLRSSPGDAPTIEAPDDADEFTIAESSPTWEPIVFAYGGHESGGTVSGSGTVDVSVSGLEIDGRGVQPDARRKVGVLYRNVRSGQGPATIENNHVKRMAVGGHETMGILAYGDSAVKVSDNTVTDFERGGIGANGDGGAHPSPTMHVRNNHLDSGSSPAVAWAPNGVQIGFGAHGDVLDNTVLNCRWAESTDDPWSASGVLVFESDAVSIRGNTFENNDVAVAASSWGWFLASADNNRIVRNTISDALIGVHLRATAWDGVTGRDPSVSNNKVVNNTIDDPSDGPDGETGVLIQKTDSDDEHDPVVRNNKVIRNTITGFTTPVADDGSDTKIRAIEP